MCAEILLYCTEARKYEEKNSLFCFFFIWNSSEQMACSHTILSYCDLYTELNISVLWLHQEKQGTIIEHLSLNW